MHKGQQDYRRAWAIVEGLARLGLREVVISPGSRSAPLVLAFDDHPDIKTYSAIDERAAGFVGLGMSKALQRPVALLCTSGSAGAHYYPAICEAHTSGVGLIAITANRPQIARRGGAHQSMEQANLYGDKALAFLELTEPTRSGHEELRALAQNLMHLYQVARKGPIHIDVAFERPEPPESRQLIQQHVNAIYDRFDVRPPGIQADAAPESVEEVAQILTEARRPVAFVGADEGGDTYRASLLGLASSLGMPILAEVASQLRSGSDPTGLVVSHPSVMLHRDPAAFEPDVILRMGRPPIDWPVQRWLRAQEHARHMYIGERLADPDRQVSVHIPTHPRTFLGDLSRRIGTGETAESRPSPPDVSVTLPEELCDFAVWPTFLKRIPPDSQVFVASSMAARDVETFVGFLPEGTRIWGNRGLNGIDGLVATACGISLALEQPVCLLIGDVALAHDLASLGLAGRLGAKLRIVLVNNAGGAIFAHTPMGRLKNTPGYREHFITAPGLDFSRLADAFGVGYRRIVSLSDTPNYEPEWGQEFLDDEACVLWEAQTDADRTRELREVALMGRQIPEDFGIEASR